MSHLHQDTRDGVYCLAGVCLEMEEHIQELEKLGVTRPAATPLFYRVAAARLTLANAIEASGGQSEPP